MNDLMNYSLTDELYREYDFGGRSYRIDNPQRLYYRVGGSTHRVVDSNDVVHLLPGPGYRGCVIRWAPKDILKAVQF